jgi:Tfp pilus assembly protein FimT
MTAVELLTVVVLLVILAAFAIPSISPVVLRQRLSGAAWQLGGDLRLARQRAVTERKRFRVCVTSCAISVPPGSYSIERDDGTWVSDTGVAVKLPQDVTVTSTWPTATFSTNGMVTPSPTFTVSNIIGTYEIAIASTGRVKVCQGTCP